LLDGLSSSQREACLNSPWQQGLRSRNGESVANFQQWNQLVRKIAEELFFASHTFDAGCSLVGSTEGKRLRFIFSFGLRTLRWLTQNVQTLAQNV
jgi:hypothetical protein